MKVGLPKIWNNPVSGYCNLADVLPIAKRIKDLGFRLLLDFHYSDSWADPGHQTKPVAWQGYSVSDLSNAVFTYTKDVITALKSQDSLPDMVQIGNEITPGMLWPEGRVSGFSYNYDYIYIGGTFNNWGTSSLTKVSNNLHEIVLTNPSGEIKFTSSQNWSTQWGDTNSDGIADIVTNTGGNIPIPAIRFNDITFAYTISTNSFIGRQNWQRLSSFLKAGVAGVKSQLSAGENVKIMLHIDRGGDNVTSRKFYDKIKENGVNYDLIGLSYYPWWHKDLSVLSNNLADLVVRYDKEVIVVETAYPWTTDWSDNENNVVGSGTTLLPEYPATVSGQGEYLKALVGITKSVGSKGVFYWAPENIACTNHGSSWENLALFDFSGNLLESANEFK